MTSEEFASSVQRGLGRAALCLLDNDPTPYLPALLDACLIDHRQTVWVEDPRGEYLLTLADFAGALPAVEDHVLTHLPSIEDEWDRKQAWRILRDLAERGYPRARAAVLAYALQDKTGAEYVAAWGAEGLRWLLASRPNYFAGEYDHEIDHLIDCAEGASGKAVVDALLPPALREARIAYSQRESAPSKREEEPRTVAILIAQLKGAKRWSRRHAARRFGIYAPIEERRAFAEAMLSLKQPRLLKLLANAFKFRPWPLDPTLVFDRLNDPKVGWAWRRALATVEDDRMRTVAWSLLESESPPWDATEFLILNMQPGEEERLLRVLERGIGIEPWQIHNMAPDIVYIADRLGIEGMVPHLEWVIENTPCSLCRVHAMERLAKAGRLSDRYRQEAIFDSEEDVRALADDRAHVLLAPERFSYALRRGLGRAEGALRERPIPGYIERLLWSGLFVAPYARFEHGPRAVYLANLLEVAQVEERFLSRLLELLDLPHEDDDLQTWRIALLAEFAQRGNERALARWTPEQAPGLPSSEEAPPATDIEELLRRFQANPASRGREAERFGLAAPEEERRKWAERMLQEEDVDVAWAMGHAFRKEPWPLDAEAVITRASVEGRGSQIWRLMLKEMDNPEIREFALARLAADPPDLDSIGFLRQVYEPGDEDAMMATLKRVDLKKEGVVYRLSRDLMVLARGHGTEPFIPLLEWVVENSPSSRLRTHAIECLLRLNALSDYHRREAAFDAEPATRAVVQA